MLFNKVVICDKVQVYNIFPEVLLTAGFEPREYSLVLVKANLCGMYHPELQLLEYTLRFFESRAKRIVIGETDSMRNTPEEQFRVLGVSELLKRFN